LDQMGMLFFLCWYISDEAHTYPSCIHTLLCVCQEHTEYAHTCCLDVFVHLANTSVFSEMSKNRHDTHDWRSISRPTTWNM